MCNNENEKLERLAVSILSENIHIVYNLMLSKCNSEDIKDKLNTIKSKFIYALIYKSSVYDQVVLRNEYKEIEYAIDYTFDFLIKWYSKPKHVNGSMVDCVRIFLYLSKSKNVTGGNIINKDIQLLLNNNRFDMIKIIWKCVPGFELYDIEIKPHQIFTMSKSNIYFFFNKELPVIKRSTYISIYNYLYKKINRTDIIPINEEKDIIKLMIKNNLI